MTRINHKVIIKLVNKLFPHENANKEGVCYGFSAKFLDAFLIGEKGMKTLHSRVNLPVASHGEY